VRFSDDMGFCYYFGCVSGYFWGTTILRGEAVWGAGLVSEWR
jgi:hypothetical protein